MGESAHVPLSNLDISYPCHKRSMPDPAALPALDSNHALVMGGARSAGGSRPAPLGAPWKGRSFQQLPFANGADALPHPPHGFAPLSASTSSPITRSCHSLEYAGRSATLGRCPTSSRSASNDTSLSRNPSLTPQRRLARSGPQRIQSSPRPRACAQRQASPSSNASSPILTASPARARSSTVATAPSRSLSSAAIYRNGAGRALDWIHPKPTGGQHRGHATEHHDRTRDLLAA